MGVGRYLFYAARRSDRRRRRRARADQTKLTPRQWAWTVAISLPVTAGLFAAESSVALGVVAGLAVAAVELWAALAITGANAKAAPPPPAPPPPGPDVLDDLYWATHHPGGDASRRRCSDAARDRAASMLADAARDGRITTGELDARAGAAARARTYGDLAAALSDL